MALITCAGADGLVGRLHIPERSTWSAWMTLDTATAPTGSVTLAAAGGLSLKGFVIDSGVFCDVAHVHLVGGAGGLSKNVSPASYQNAQLRDPLDDVLRAVGESLSAKTSSSVLAVQLPDLTVIAEPAVGVIDSLCAAASDALGAVITWRVLDDGTVWLGAEEWTSQKLSSADDVLEAFPDQGRFVIGVETPSLVPGVDLAGVGKVVAVDHWFTHDEVRTWAWV